jgi:thioredoxin-dependent peroxiredoxin
MEATRFRDRIDAFHSKQAVLLGVSTDPPEENKRFKEEQRLPFPLLSDVNRDACLAYRTCAFRTAYYADRITYIIDERGIISRVYRDVDPREHASEILAAI